nr:apolipoprotein N-acyltransferase [Pseudohoeflea sp. DP4N28-3]
MLACGWRRASLAFVAGALGALALAPVNFFAVMFISLPVLVWLLDGASSEGHGGLVMRMRPAFMVGWWFGFGYFIAGLWWLGNALLADADQFAWALPLAVIGLPAVLALFYGAATALARLFWNDGFGRIALFSVSFALLEYARQFLLTGFPWNALGQTIAPVPLMMQTAGLIGLDGLNLLAVFIFAAPALLVTRRGRTPGLLLAAALFSAHLGYGFYALRDGPSELAGNDALRVRIVQPAVDQAAKWEPADREAIFAGLLTLTAAPPGDGLEKASAEGPGKPDLIIWPETAVPFLLTSNPEALARIAQTLQAGQLLLAGAVRVEDAASTEPRYYNSVYAIDDAGEIVAAADKVHLVPFGEYLPFESVLGWFGLRTIAESFGGFSAAPNRQFLTLPGDRRALPLICYEAIFPAQAEIEGNSGDMLINVTNDGWFGATPGPYQHLQQARLRAVEVGRPMLRAANSGISSIIDARGRLLGVLPLGQRGNLDMAISTENSARSSYAKRQLNFWSLFAIMVLIGLFARGSKWSARD